VERIHVGKGVYRSLDNTQLFEVFTDEQMKQRKNGTAYKVLKKAKAGGGVHGIKVLAYKNKHKRVEYENADLVSKEQLEVIKRTVGMVDPPEVAYSEVGAPPSARAHDHSKDAALVTEDDLPDAITEGTNIGNINPETVEPYEEDDHELFDETGLGDDDVERLDEDESETDGTDGAAAGSTESAEYGPEPEQGGEFVAEPDEESDSE